LAKRIIIAMSGGVDSSVSAHLLKEKGYDVIGVTLKMFSGQENILEDAENVAKKLGIEWYFADYSEHFPNDVISYFINTYRKGMTPNPCCFCNKYAKMKYLFEQMQKLGAEKIATGHYAKKVFDGNHHYIAKAKNAKKDQSYYLCLLDEFYVNLLEFPLGNIGSKYEVRKIAEELNLDVAKKRDSQDVCFLQGNDYKDYLKEKIPESKLQKGNFIYKGRILKSHEGIEFYTTGQRRGLNTDYHKPLYVVKIDPETKNIYLGDKQDLYFRGVKIENCNFITNKKFFKAEVKLRYRMKSAKCVVERLPSNEAVILFNEKQTAPTPGQIAAVYSDNIVLGGGFIKNIF